MHFDAFTRSTHQDAIFSLYGELQPRNFTAAYLSPQTKLSVDCHIAVSATSDQRGFVSLSLVVLVLFSLSLALITAKSLQYKKIFQPLPSCTQLYRAFALSPLIYWSHAFKALLLMSEVALPYSAVDWTEKRLWKGDLWFYLRPCRLWIRSFDHAHSRSLDGGKHPILLESHVIEWSNQKASPSYQHYRSIWVLAFQATPFNTLIYFGFLWPHTLDPQFG